MQEIAKNTKIGVGLSGGVDSAVSALLLKQAGYNVTGFHMVLSDVGIAGCRADQDRADALKVAKQLKIPFRVVDFRETYQQKVIDRFVNDYSRGVTPNPDIWCNEEIKFGLFYDYLITEMGLDFMATGHYADVEQRKNSKHYQLRIPTDRSKDQTYFLYSVPQHKLAKTLFPLGEKPKKQVRMIAEDSNLLIANKPDSVGICFIGDIDIVDFLISRLGENPGNVLNINGEIIGKHKGAYLYTIGQKHGLEILKPGNEPLYVVEKDISRNVLVVGNKQNPDVNKIYINRLVESYPDSVSEIIEADNVYVRIRHLGELIKLSHVTQPETDADSNAIISHLAESIYGVASGQHAVFYKNDIVVGGGVITDAV